MYRDLALQIGGEAVQIDFLNQKKADQFFQPEWWVGVRDARNRLSWSSIFRLRRSIRTSNVIGSESLSLHHRKIRRWTPIFNAH
jgi:hypothetical protein